MSKYNEAKAQEMSCERATALGSDHPCFEGQWTVHEPHDYEVHVQDWLGGGTAMVHCPGKTAETVLR